MSEKKLRVPLGTVLMLPGGKNINNLFIDIIIDDEIPVLCTNRKTGKERLMPFKVLYDNHSSFWLQYGSWDYFLSKDNHEKLKELAIAKTRTPDFMKIAAQYRSSYKKDEDLEELAVDVGYGNEYKAIAKMTNEEKIECLNKNNKRLSTLLIQKDKDADVVTEALVDSTKEAALINHAVLKEAINLADDEARRFSQEFVDTTHEMVKSSTQLFSKDLFSDELMNTLVEKSNGTIVQHMTRVYLNGIAFLSYYNNLVSTSSAIQKLRVSFSNKYRKYYQSMLPHIIPDDINLERVFYGGMRAIPPEQVFKWALGFLLHDIGKASAVEYHEGEAKYDRNIVIDHVKMGYKSIVTKTNYPMESSLITGYHHEYYGSTDGYGYFRAYLQQYKKQNQDAKQDYCITYELEPIMDYKALAYFPAKMLEIIDVFDSVTDPNRVYRKPMTPEDALKMMREEFIEKKCKIDIILFDIFTTFINEKEKERRKTAKAS